MPRADVYKDDILAATIGREPDGVTAFAYTEQYLQSGAEPVATTLPLSDRPKITAAGAVPPFFAGLLPEGRRLTGLRRSIKASADDELALLLAIGGDLVGDVRVVPTGDTAIAVAPVVTIDAPPHELLFADLLADAGIVDRVGIAGVQDKVSARMISLPVSRSGERYILKLAPPEFPHVVENEAFFLELARTAGLPTARARVIHDADSVSGLLVTRFDRTADGRRLAMEDACQALALWPADKYNTTMEQASSALINACAATSVAALAVFRQAVFAWLTGNGDLHAKNLSILQPTSGEWRISPLYDLPTTVIYDDLTFALTINGEDRDIRQADLLAFAETIGLSTRAARSVIAKLAGVTTDLVEQIRTAGLPFERHHLSLLGDELRRRRELLEM